MRPPTVDGGGGHGGQEQRHRQHEDPLRHRSGRRSTAARRPAAPAAVVPTSGCCRAPRGDWAHCGMSRGWECAAAPPPVPLRPSRRHRQFRHRRAKFLRELQPSPCRVKAYCAHANGWRRGSCRTSDTSSRICTNRSSIPPPGPADAVNRGDRRRIQRADRVAVDRDGGIERHVEAVQRGEGRHRRVDDHRRGPVEADVDLFLVFVLAAERVVRRT